MRWPTTTEYGRLKGWPEWTMGLLREHAATAMKGLIGSTNINLTTWVISVLGQDRGAMNWDHMPENEKNICRNGRHSKEDRTCRIISTWDPISEATLTFHLNKLGQMWEKKRQGSRLGP